MLNCAQCHVVNGVGTDFGPEQSDVASRLSKRELYEAIIDPSNSIAEEYTPYLFEFRDGRLATGFIVSEIDNTLQLKLEGGVVEEFDVRDVIDRQEQPLSAMPSDMYQMITAGELADLVEYLGTLKVSE